MKPDVFYFRDFSMLQAPSGQRVNTDSCVFGAVIGPTSKPSRILDIGTGTGVLALMLASRFPEAQITAVEPELSIAEIARENFQASPWRDRIEVIVSRAQDLSPGTIGSFDFVLCNPPYFQNSMISDNHLRMVARHNTDLSPVELYVAMKRMMTEQGSVWLSFPEDSNELWFRQGLEAGFHLTHQVTVMDHPGAKPHMTVAGWSLVKPVSTINDVIHYRMSHKGSASQWMRTFREQWYPARFNAQFF
jgi:tRNA1Val (adenine37-N6)-methyltransferase